MYIVPYRFYRWNCIEGHYHDEVASLMEVTVDISNSIPRYLSWHNHVYLLNYFLFNRPKPWQGVFLSLFILYLSVFAWIYW